MLDVLIAEQLLYHDSYRESLY